MKEFLSDHKNALRWCQIVCNASVFEILFLAIFEMGEALMILNVEIETIWDRFEFLRTGNFLRHTQCNFVDSLL